MRVNFGRSGSNTTAASWPEPAVIRPPRAWRRDERRESRLRWQNKLEPICSGPAMPLTGVDGNALTSAGLVQDPVETLRRTQHRLTPRLTKRGPHWRAAGV